MIICFFHSSLRMSASLNTTGSPDFAPRYTSPWRSPTCIQRDREQLSTELREQLFSEQSQGVSFATGLRPYCNNEWRIELRTRFFLRESQRDVRQALTQRGAFVVLGPCCCGESLASNKHIFENQELSVTISNLSHNGAI